LSNGGRLTAAPVRRCGRLIETASVLQKPNTVPPPTIAGHDPTAAIGPPQTTAGTVGQRPVPATTYKPAHYEPPHPPRVRPRDSH